jgi:hypothetical protein
MISSESLDAKGSNDPIFVYVNTHIININTSMHVDRP